MKLSDLKPYLLIAAVAAAGYFAYVNRGYILYKAESVLPEGERSTEQGIISEELLEEDFKTVATGLEIPWEIAFLPSGDLLVTERPGRIKRVAKDGAMTEVTGLADVRHSGEGGLLGLALHPKFAENGLLYVYQTISTGGGAKNRVDRYRMTGDALTERTTIIQNIPGALYHDGGELAFSPDGKLYVTTGDASQPAFAQDLKSMAGKILRLNDDGTIPGDNPYDSAVWSYGHRNPQGLAWDGQGRLWATEHGRSGALSGYDELNLIEKGKNYGWPVIQGPEEGNGMSAPAAQSGSSDTWAPAGIAHYEGVLLFGGLRGESLYQADLGSTPLKIVSHFEKEYGRIRAVVVGPDKMLYFTTSNRDGRGDVRQGDDRIVRVNPRLFQ